MDSPSETTFRGLLAKIDPQALELAPVDRMGVAALDRSGTDRPAALSVDGKRLCGTLSQHAAALQAVNVWDHLTGCVLRQQFTGDTNEVKTVVEIFRALLEGQTVPGVEAFCQQILDSGGDYLLVVNDNQPQLPQDAQSAFRDSRRLSPLPTQATPSPATAGNWSSSPERPSTLSASKTFCRGSSEHLDYPSDSI